MVKEQRGGVRECVKTEGVEAKRARKEEVGEGIGSVLQLQKG